MAAKSRSVSHATLHEAAKGSRFPSWTTTQAFVEACGGDVEEWRELWCAALGAEGQDSPAPRAVEDETEAAGRTPLPELEQGRRLGGIAIVVGCLLLGVAALGTYALWPSGKHETDAKPTETATSRAPLVSGDRSRLIADVTIPDGTVVKTGHRFVKTWEIANVGTRPWRGRYLMRAALPADNGTCSTPGKVPIPDTKPSAHVRISVRVTAPSAPGSCWVGWKMVDGQGRLLLPGARPVFFSVKVVR
jgi:hypothetical protein